jgi:hypothetical protein
MLSSSLWDLYILQGGGADTLKFNLHIMGRAKKHAKKGCEFNQKRCEFKILQKKLTQVVIHNLSKF